MVTKIKKKSSPDWKQIDLKNRIVKAAKMLNKT
jgi:hypothetical protein